MDQRLKVLGEVNIRIVHQFQYDEKYYGYIGGILLLKFILSPIIYQVETLINYLLLVQ